MQGACGCARRRATCSAPSCPASAAAAQTPRCVGQPSSSSQPSASTCPPPCHGQHATSYLPRSLIFICDTNGRADEQHLDESDDLGVSSEWQPAHRCELGCSWRPLAAMGAGELQNPDIAAPARRIAEGGQLNRAAVGPCPLQAHPMPAGGRSLTDARVPLAVVCPQPSQNGQLPRFRRREAHLRVQRAAVGLHPLEHAELAGSSHLHAGADARRPAGQPRWHRESGQRLPEQQPVHDGCDGHVLRSEPSPGQRAGQPEREAGVDRVPQRPAAQRERERVVLGDRIGDQSEAAARVEALEEGAGERGSPAGGAGHLTGGAWG